MNEELKVIISAEVGKLKAATEQAKQAVNSFKDQVAKASKDVDASMKKVGEKMGSAIKAGCKVAATAIAAMGTALAGFVAGSIKNFAEYEQLVGGVEKLFGNSAKTVQKYAQDAYKTAGLSANEYMTQVTSFSASLISSMGGDTKAAADRANMAIVDMADNVNVFGSNMTDVQNAYQGFAKQNYTMLDNLKLGYGGTKEEMQRLIDDANKLAKANGEAGDLTIDSYADVIEAIHLVQTEMNITGATAKEAEGTIEGSINMTKAAWQNLMTGLADSNADIPQLVSNVVSSATSVLKNVIPVAKQVLKSLPAAISEVSPQAGAAMQVVVNAITKALPVLMDALSAALDLVSKIFTFASEHKGLLIAVGAAIGVVAAAIGAYNVVAAVKAAMAAAEVTTVWGLVAAYAAQAVAMAAALAPYIAIAAAIAAVIAVIVLCVKHWDEIKAKVKEVAKAIGDKVKEMAKAVSDKFKEIQKAITEKIEAAKKAVKDKFDAIKKDIKSAVDTAKNTVKNAFDAVKTAVSNAVNTAKSKVSSAFSNIKSSISSAVNSAKSKVSSVFSGIKSSISNAVSGAYNTVSSKFNSIKSKISSTINAARDTVKNAVDRIKGAFNFSWSLPHIKLPHFSVSGGKAPWGFGGKGSLPSVSVSWYAKGGVFDSPFLFGYGNGAMGGLGEDGAEAIVPLEKNTKWLDRLATMLNEKQGRGGVLVLQVDGKTFAQCSLDAINANTRATGRLGLQLV